jgi:peptide-methionine (S)-S-oxide reductase
MKNLAWVLAVLSFAPGAWAGEVAKPRTETATFAGGCFWCMQPVFDALIKEGVISTTVGYTGGKEPNPTYEDVSEHRTGHREAIEVLFDPARLTYKRLVDVFWHNIDPMNPDGQFCDTGFQYKSAIFYHGDKQRKVADESKAELAKRGTLKAGIFTDILPAQKFWPAEEYHQKFYEKNPERYLAYKTGCRRQKRLEEVWGAEAPRH